MKNENEEWTQKQKAHKPAGIALPKKEPTLKERIVASVDPERREVINNLDENELLYAVIRAVDLGLPLRIDTGQSAPKSQSRTRIIGEDERAYSDLGVLPRLIFGEEYDKYRQTRATPQQSESSPSPWERLGMYAVDRVTENQEFMRALSQLIVTLAKKMEGK